jgi:NADPH:quinone reductase-like Zn-dependent oxidoreductase
MTVPRKVDAVALSLAMKGLPHGQSVAMMVVSRIALVTGAAGGIGRAIAALLVVEGASVILTERRKNSGSRASPCVS